LIWWGVDIGPCFEESIDFRSEPVGAVVSVNGTRPIVTPDFHTHVPQGFFDAPSQLPCLIISSSISSGLGGRKGSILEGLKVSSCHSLLFKECETIKKKV
jgi:hypothetical protein